MAHKKNPFDTIIVLSKKSERALEYLLKKAPEEDVINGFRQIRSQLKEKEKKVHKLPPSITRIEKLLLEYPGFQKEILDTLTSRVKSAKEMGVIYKYEDKSKTEVKTKAEVKTKTEPKIKAETKSDGDMKVKPSVLPDTGPTGTIVDKPVNKPVEESEESTWIPSWEEINISTKDKTKDDLKEKKDSEPRDRLKEIDESNTRNEFLTKTVQIDTEDMKAHLRRE